MSDPARVAAAFEAACRAELEALKPGNVHVFSSGHGMETAHFAAAAAAAAMVIAVPGLTVGARIERAVAASLAAAGCNTNLGIVLLAAPLVAAALEAGPGDLRARLAGVLARLDVADAEAAFRAIAVANPGGLGTEPAADVRAPARLSLKEAMALAAPRDRIAGQYVSGYADVFAIGVARLAQAEAPGRAATEAAYLDFLAAFPDSHILRKFGAGIAEAVRAEADAIRGRLAGADGDVRHAGLLAFDTSLKARGINPGTSADLTVASLLAFALQQQEGACRGP